jgi:mannose-6-phosphate isomerase
MSADTSRPLRLAPNLVDHFYRGGQRIGALRGIEVTSSHQPEEWIAATVSRADAPGVGLASTVDGQLLRDLVAADPGGWLGPRPDGAARHGDADTGLLVKLLDAGQRLPVHVHPDRAFAARHLDCPYGKTEAWFILDSVGDGAVYLGWTEDVDPQELARRRDEQDSRWMLERMHRIEVAPGDGVLVPAGQAHAIGEGVFLAEVQEPTDFSILLEWSITTSHRDESHLGLGFDTVMGAVEHGALSPARLAELRRHTDLGDPVGDGSGVTSCLPAAADPFFRLHLLDATSAAPSVGAGFAAVVVLDGAGGLVTPSGREELRRGDVLAVPHGCGDWHVEGAVRLLVARPGTPQDDGTGG